VIFVVFDRSVDDATPQAAKERETFSLEKLHLFEDQSCQVHRPVLIRFAACHAGLHDAVRDG